MPGQPFVHDLVVTLAAPVQAWSRDDGTMTGTGVSGVFVGDTRVLRQVDLSISDAAGAVALSPLTHDVRGGATASFTAMVRIATDIADPLVALTRTRTASPARVTEELTVTSALEEPLDLELTLAFIPDATPMNVIKAGHEDNRPFTRDALSWTWADGASASLDLPGADVTDGDTVVARWSLHVAPGASESVRWAIDLTDPTVPFVPYTGTPLAVPALEGADPELTRLVRRSVADLNALRLAERHDPGVGFVAAGAPWFLTLFGRDSLLSARLFLPADPQLAVDTLRVLAGRQGRAVNVDRAEAPGKILHEVRGGDLDLLDGTVLPPEYYGTIDATPLWICLLGQAWKAGVPDATIAPFMDALAAALDWLEHYSDPDSDGFLEYFDASGHGLANQGWKDSGDSVRFADGRIADGPIALVEVQGYAYQAARAASELLRHFGRDQAERDRATFWDGYADAMAARVRERFWVSDADGRYPALALDAHKRPVDGVASNMGHLLATGLLTPEEERLIVDRMLDLRMFSGYGIRTMSSDNSRYWPARYHVGSVWTHDTAMAIEGMPVRGYVDEARTLARGLLLAARGFGGALPELFGGQDAATTYPPAPYPASCHPQAWAAASAITVARALGALD